MSQFEELQHYLPDIVIEIAELIGFPLTEKLVKKLGGLQFLIVKNVRVTHRYQMLVDAVGYDAAQALIGRFGGEQLYIPRCSLALKQLRNVRFIAECDFLKNSGVSITQSLEQLCPQYGFSERFARKLLAEYRHPRKNTAQRTLF